MYDPTRDPSSLQYAAAVARDDAIERMSITITDALVDDREDDSPISKAELLDYVDDDLRERAFWLLYTNPGLLKDCGYRDLAKEIETEVDSKIAERAEALVDDACNW